MATSRATVRERASAPRREPTPRLEIPDAPKLRVVPEVVRRRRAGVFTALVICVVFGAMVALTAFQAQLAANQFILDGIEQQLRDERAQFERNRLKVAQLQSPQHVLEEAKKLGMKLPEETTYISASADVVTVVMRAVGGGPDSATATGSGSGHRPDWVEYKQVMGTSG